MHHIITDAWSMAILVEEIASLYDAFRDDRPSPLTPLPIQYADYAAWEHEAADSGVLETQVAYWKAVLTGPPPPLTLPEDHRGAQAIPNNGARVAFVAAESTLAGLKALCRDEGVTLFMTLMASWQLLLYNYSREPDILVGTPTANRDQPEVERLIGVFVNTLVLKTHFEPDARIRDSLRQVREIALGAFANQRLPFDKVVEAYWRDRRGLERTPLFRTWFVLQNVPIATPRLGDILVTPMDANSLMAVHPLKLSIVENDDTLDCAIDYRTHLFERTTIDRMRGLFEHLLDLIIADPTMSVGSVLDRLSALEVEMLDADERHRDRARAAALGQTRRQQILSSIPSE
jgi:non-ribosomal peptide synthetase component F